MRPSSLRPLSAALCLLLSVSASGAATYSYSIHASASEYVTDPSGFSFYDNGFDNRTASGERLNATSGAGTSAFTRNAITDKRVTVDGQTGALTSATNFNNWCDPATPCAGSAGGYIEMSETFTLNGTGALSALMSVFKTSNAADASLFASVSMGSRFARSINTDRFETTGITSGASRKLEVQSIFRNAVDAQVTVTWHQTLTAGGQAQAISHAFLTTTGTLTATPTNANFLSTATPIAPVPLPASGLALLAALGALALRARRRS